jgi:hypothetical protein
VTFFLYTFRISNYKTQTSTTLGRISKMCRKIGEGEGSGKVGGGRGEGSSNYKPKLGVVCNVLIVQILQTQQRLKSGVLYVLYSIVGMGVVQWGWLWFSGDRCDSVGIGVVQWG